MTIKNEITLKDLDKQDEKFEKTMDRIDNKMNKTIQDIEKKNKLL